MVSLSIGTVFGSGVLEGVYLPPPVFFLVLCCAQLQGAVLLLLLKQLQRLPGEEHHRVRVKLNRGRGAVLPQIGSP